jgi:hypothetical protein
VGWRVGDERRKLLQKLEQMCALKMAMCMSLTVWWRTPSLEILQRRLPTFIQGVDERLLTWFTFWL